MIDFDLAANASIDWLTVGKVLRGIMPIEAFPDPVRVVVLDSRATEWDAFVDGGSRGLFSMRFVEVLGPEALVDFQLFPARLNGKPYYFLRCNQFTDCLDRERSRFSTFPHDSSRVMDVENFVFRKNCITGGKLFCLPEIPDLLATDAIAAKIRRSSLRGVLLQPVP